MSDKKVLKITVLIVAIGVSGILGIIFLPPFFDTLGPIPEFVENDWIELNKIANISKYRSTIGHGYPYDENPTSDKHYFDPYNCYKNSNDNISVFAPVAVSVIQIEWENHQLTGGEIRGKQVRLKSTEHPSITFVFFHVNTEPTALAVGQALQPGQLVGYCDVRENSNTDIAVYRGDSTISWFQVLTPTLMATYNDRGIIKESIIKTDAQVAESKDNGYSFSQSDPNDWVDLTGANPCP